MSDLRKAAEAVLERWDSPAWEWMKQGPTAELMAALRAALAAPRPEPVAWIWQIPLYAAPPVAAPSEDIEALRLDAERYRWLRDTFTVAKGGATVTFNEELGNYETPIAGTEVSLQWYPETPIGSYHVEASTLNAAIDAAMQEVPR